MVLGVPLMSVLATYTSKFLEKKKKQSEEKKEIIVNYENCLECGACRIACERKAIDWKYPKGTKGVTFKQG
ncbi:MAG: 4Fe-4S dicluster domain-containing protein, partial [Cyanobacteriota bacterium]|nr:4Fe-4S dicluster domain-containing protein [Cyanobacteriota bacterium]